MRSTRQFTAAVFAFGLAVTPLAAAQADDAHHPAAAAAAPMAGCPGGMMENMGSGMGSGMMGAGMMDPSMMKRMHGGMEFPPHAAMRGELSLTPDQAREILDARLIMHGNDRLRVGAVKAAADGIVATVETVDGSLVRTLRIDPATGVIQAVN